MKKENFIATMAATYAILLTLSIALYAWIDIFKLDKSLASNLLVWSATIYAPIAVLYGLHFWKIEKKELEKIECLKKLKDHLVEFYILVDDLRGSSNIFFKMRNSESVKAKEQVDKFIKDFREKTKQFFFEMNRREEYFNPQELDLITEKLNTFLEVSNAFSKAFLIVETCTFSLPRHSLLSGEYLEFEKNIYLLDPNCIALNLVKSEIDDKKILENFEHEKIFKNINDLTGYISLLIDNAYK